MTDHAKDLDMLGDCLNKLQLGGSTITAKAADELRRLHAENASLWALAKFGSEVLAEFMTVSDIRRVWLLARAKEHYLIEMPQGLAAPQLDPRYKLTPLAQLPAKQND